MSNKKDNTEGYFDDIIGHLVYVEFNTLRRTPRISEISFRASDEKTTHSIFAHCSASHGAYAHKHWTSTTTSILDYSKMLLNLGCCYTVMKNAEQVVIAGTAFSSLWFDFLSDEQFENLWTTVFE